MFEYACTAAIVWGNFFFSFNLNSSVNDSRPIYLDRTNVFTLKLFEKKKNMLYGEYKKNVVKPYEYITHTQIRTLHINVYSRGGNKFDNIPNYNLYLYYNNEYLAITWT